VTETAIEISDATRRRIELNRKSGWGLEKGTPPQLQMVALYCDMHNLLPGDDVTLYDGKPWLTIDGRVKLMRRHPAYISHRQHPLSKEEKVAWGYEEGDIVVVTTIKLLSHGSAEEIEAHGRVSVAELTGKPAFERQRLNPLARRGLQAVEMAQKRSLARAERFAFGTEALVDDADVDEAARMVVEERANPEKVAANARRYDEIYAPEDDEPYVPTRERDLGDRSRQITEQAHAAAEARDRTLDEIEAQRQRAQEGLL
jgi:hypothetical protein